MCRFGCDCTTISVGMVIGTTNDSFTNINGCPVINTSSCKFATIWGTNITYASIGCISLVWGHGEENIQSAVA